MPETTFSLHWHAGPAQINGVTFANVHISEHADSDGIVIHKGWEGTAKVPALSAPEITPAWLEATMQEPVTVRLPEGAEGKARVTGAAHIDDDGARYWTIDFTGVGPSPWAEDA